MTVVTGETSEIRPRRVLFWALMGVYFVFLGGLVLMWYETVHGAKAAEPVPTEIRLVMPEGPASRP